MVIEYDLNELAIIYDSLEYLKNKYNKSVNIVNKSDVAEVKLLINIEINKLIAVLNDEREIEELKKYLL